MASVEIADFRFELNGAEAHFSPTSDDTSVLVAELPGCGDSNHHNNHLDLFPLRDLYAFFCWLNVIAL